MSIHTTHALNRIVNKRNSLGAKTKTLETMKSCSISFYVTEGINDQLLLIQGFQDELTAIEALILQHKE